MKVLVTGGCGFIGSHLVDELVARGHEVKIIGLKCDLDNIEAVKDKVEFVKVDVTNKDQVIAAIDSSIDAVFHLAALINVDQSRVMPDAFLQTNVIGTANVLEATRKRNIPRLLHMSTCEVYGNIPKGKADENHATNPRSPYAASKFSAERYLLAYSYTFPTPNITIIRGFNQFGPRQNAGADGAVIPIFTSLLLKDQPIKIFGDGKQSRDYVFVKDTVRGLVDALEKKDIPSGEAINLATGVETSVVDIAQKICKILGKDPKKYVTFGTPRPGELMRSVGDFSKAKKMLGWEPKVSFDQGLKLTVDWFKEKFSE